MLANADDVGDVQEANAVVLLHEIESVITEKGQIKTTVRIATKILSLDGVDDAIFTESITPTLKVKDLKGWHRNSMGKVRSLKKENIVEVGLQEAAGMYDDAMTIGAAFADVQPGDVVAYQYRIEQKDESIGYYKKQILQDSLPIRRVRYSLTIPDGWQLHFSGRNLEPVIHHVSENKHVWEAKNLSWRPGEQYMPPWDYLLRRVDVSCYDPSENQARQFQDWKAVGSWVWDIHEESILINDSLERLVTGLCHELVKPSEKLRGIAEFVQDEIRYVAIEIGEGRFRPREAASTLFNRYGDCKDKVTLMRSMLKVVGIPSQPVLALVGSTVDSLFPTPFQFNHVIIAIPFDSVYAADFLSNSARVHRWLLFDPTDPSCPLGLLPAVLQGTAVLIASEADGVLHLVPCMQPGDWRRQYTADATLGEDHSLSAAVRITDFGSRAAATGYYRRTTPVEDMIEEHREKFAECITNPIITNFLLGANSDSSWVAFNLSGEHVTSVTGGYTLLKLDFFFSDSPPGLPDDGRIHPFWFGWPRREVTDVRWSLPAEWTVEKPNDSADSFCGIGRIEYRLAGADSTIRAHTVREYSGGLLPADDYESAYRFLRDSRSIRNRRVFMTRKVTE